MYQIVLSVHVIAVISWMAGILYLLRLLVYHRIETEKVVKDRFEVMEYRLYRYITNPAMIVALVFGVWMLVLNSFLLSQPWMHIKLTAVVLLIGVTHYAKAMMKKFKRGEMPKTEKYFRILNEIPTLLMIIIVVMVIVRPF
ncbi:MAG: protoporphyrinogen oxidase HemJ [Bdellovibrionales bacterium]|nr:protoporphyrinogen oxidase HemJ [Bdellovibrionales bacterium]